MKPKITIGRKACAVCGLRSAGYLCDNCRYDLPGLLSRLQQQHAALSERCDNAARTLQEAISAAQPADLDRFTKVQAARAQNAPDFAKRYAATLALTDGLGAIVRAEKAYSELQPMLASVESSISVVKFAISERHADEMVQAAGVDWELVGSEA